MTKNTKIPDKQKYLLFAELHSLLSSGMSFSRSFNLLIQNEEKKSGRRRLEELYNGIVRGNPFWKSMVQSEGFTMLDSGVIRIGEETGKLGNSLQFLCDYYDKKTTQNRMIAGALSYPAIILVTAVLVLIFMVVFVIPMFEQVYLRMGSELPALTRAIVNMSKKLPLVFSILGFVVIAAIAIHIVCGKTDRFKNMTSHFLLALPLAGNLIRKHYQAQFCKLMFLLVSADVPLLKSLDMLSSIIGFYPYSRSFIYIKNRLEKGESFSDNIARFDGLYDRKLITLMKVGEETNSLDKMLDNQAKNLSTELEHGLKQLGNILEPILILFIGVIVAFVLIAMYMPMFRLGQAFG